MKRIWIDQFKENNNIVRGFNDIIIMVPYNEDYPELSKDMSVMGFKYVSTSFVGRDLMDCEVYFKKIYL